jgi:hypothetical protein
MLTSFFKESAWLFVQRTLRVVAEAGRRSELSDSGISVALKRMADLVSHTTFVGRGPDETLCIKAACRPNAEYLNANLQRTNTDARHQFSGRQTQISAN